MERIITAAEAKQKDAQVIASGISSRVLMYNAAEGIAEAVRVRIQTGETVTAICGTGNNGGDGIAAALILHRTGCTVRIVLCGNEDRCTPDTAYYLHTAREEHIPIAGIWDPAEREILIDALFGVGLNRPIGSIQAEKQLFPPIFRPVCMQTAEGFSEKRSMQIARSRCSRSRRECSSVRDVSAAAR